MISQFPSFFSKTKVYRETHIHIEVIVACFDPDVRDDLGHVIMVEGHGITPLQKWGTVDELFLSKRR
jgi:hypothetical protein